MRWLTIALLSLCVVASADDEAWTVQSPEGGRFSVKMPASAQAKVEKVPDYGGYLDVHSIYAQGKGLAFAVYYHDIADRVPATERDRFLKKQCEGTARKHDGSIRSEKKVTVNGFPARDLVIDMPVSGGGSAVLRAKVILADKRVYQVFGWAFEKTADRPEIATFLDSFQITPLPADPPAAKAKAKRKRGN